MFCGRMPFFFLFFIRQRHSYIYTFIALCIYYICWDPLDFIVNKKLENIFHINPKTHRFTYFSKLKNHAMTNVAQKVSRSQASQPKERKKPCTVNRKNHSSIKNQKQIKISIWLIKTLRISCYLLHPDCAF